MPFVIGFGGQKRNGKDSAADYLAVRIAELGYDFKRGSLGHNVKKIMAEQFGITLEFIEEWKNKDYPPEGFDGPIRNCLTKIGDGWRETKGDIWIYKLFNGNTDNLIISDIRYINEANACRGTVLPSYMKDYTGITALCWRPGHENNKQSRSEQELMPFVRRLADEPSGLVCHAKYPDIPFDIWLRNDGNLADWHNKVDNIVIPYALEKYKQSL